MTTSRSGIEKLARFGALVLKAHRDPDPADIDGATLQELAVSAGVLVSREVTEPCGEGCSCALVTDFPTECFFTADDVREFIAHPAANGTAVRLSALRVFIEYGKVKFTIGNQTFTLEVDYPEEAGRLEFFSNMLIKALSSISLDGEASIDQSSGVPPVESALEVPRLRQPWPNGCDTSAPEALRFLARNPRPVGGQDAYNSEHLLQIAEELEAAVRSSKGRPVEVPATAAQKVPSTAVLVYALVRTTRRLTLDILWQDPKTIFMGEDDGPYFKFVARNGYEVISRSRMDIQTERIWLLGAKHKEEARSGSMVFSSDEKRDAAMAQFIKALDEWAASHGGCAVRQEAI